MNADRSIRLVSHLREMGSRDCTAGFNAHDHHMLMVAAAEIENLRSGLTILATTFYKDDQHQDYAKHILDEASPPK